MNIGISKGGGGLRKNTFFEGGMDIFGTKQIVRQSYNSCVQVEIFLLDDWSKSTGDDEVESVIKVVIRLTA